MSEAQAAVSPVIIDQNEKLIRPSVAARLLGVNRETVRAYANRGLIRYTVLPGAGRFRRYVQSDVEKLRVGA